MGHAKACLEDGRCRGPFPFTTGSLQLLSRDLAAEIASSQAARDHVELVVAQLAPEGSVYGNGSVAMRSEAARSEARSVAARRKVAYPRVPAYEDVWLGYAVHSLLPRLPNRTVTLVALEPATYTYDDWGFIVRNSSMVLHWKTSSGNVSRLALRLQLAHSLVQGGHCATQPVLACERADPLLRVCARRWRSDAFGFTAHSRRNEKSYTTQRYLACGLLPSLRCGASLEYEKLQQDGPCESERDVT